MGDAAKAGAPKTTIFCLPKPFRDSVGVIQRNALASWVRLGAGTDILVFGDEAGTAGVCAELGLRHLPSVALNEQGTPLVNHLFAEADAAAAGDILAYVNADIILGPDFLQAIRQVFRHRRRRALMVGRRTDLDVEEALGFSTGWASRLADRARREGHLHPATGIDYFVYRKGLWDEIPPFALGRTVWDNWLLFAARRRGARLVDATADVLAIHQNHDYAHHPLGKDGIWGGAEAQRNRELGGRVAHGFSIDDATHRLVDGRVRSAFKLRGLRRWVERLAIVSPRSRPVVRLVLGVLDLSYPLRARLGISGDRLGDTHGK